MSIKTMIVVIDDTAEPAEITQLIRDMPEVVEWWHHLPTAYIIRGQLNATEISRRLQKLTGEASFFVAEIDLSHSDGYLPSRAWKWIKRRERADVIMPEMSSIDENSHAK